MKRNILSSLVLALITISIYAQDPNILWQRTIGGSEDEHVTIAIETTDGGFIIGGYSNSNISGEKTENSRGGKDYWVLKFDSSGNIEWQKTIGGDQDDTLNDLKQTQDGGYILAGSSVSGISGEKTEPSRGNMDYWVLKLSATGNIEWQKTFGGDAVDIALDIVQIPDGSYILAGNSQSGISGDRTINNSGNQDIWTLKLDSNGNIEWQKAFSFVDIFYCQGIDYTDDGGYIIGSSDSQTIYSALKVSSTGNFQWQKFYSGLGPTTFMTNIKKTSDSGYILTGFSDTNAGGAKSEDSMGNFDYWILKIDQNGEKEWDNTIGGLYGEGCYNTLESTEGGYFVTGFSSSNTTGDKTEDSNGLADYWIIKLNDLGIVEWQNTMGGENDESFPKSCQLIDGSYIVAGKSDSNISGDKTENSRGGQDFWIVKHAQTLGLEENPFATAITLYPNPVENILQINTQDKTIDQVNIYTITGSKVLQLDIDTISPTVDVSSLAAGVYYVQLYSGKNVGLKKFVKE